MATGRPSVGTMLTFKMRRYSDGDEGAADRAYQRFDRSLYGYLTKVHLPHIGHHSIRPAAFEQNTSQSWYSSGRTFV